MAVLLIVGIILPLSVLINFESSELPAWNNKKTNEPIPLSFCLYIVQIVGQIAGIIATIALFLKCLHIGSTFWILKWKFYKKHRGYIMIICAFIQSLCLTIILLNYVFDYEKLVNDYIPSEYLFFNIQSMLLSFLAALLLTKDVKGRHEIYKQFGVKPAQKKIPLIQRQLIVLEILVITYILIGGVLFSSIEDWSFNNSVYFSIITLVTCGTGDFSPSTVLGRTIMIIYSIPGILLTAYSVYSIYSVISDILYSKVYTDFSRYVSSSENNLVYKEPLIIQNGLNNNEYILTKDSLDEVNNNGNEEANNKNGSSDSCSSKYKQSNVDSEVLSNNGIIRSNSMKRQHFSSPLLIPSSPTKIPIDQTAASNANCSYHEYVDECNNPLEFDSSISSLPVQSLKLDNMFNAYESDSVVSSDSELDLLLNKDDPSQNYQYNSTSITTPYPNRSFSHYRQGSTFSISSGRPRTFMLARRNTILQSYQKEMKVVAQENIDANHVIRQTRNIHMQQVKISFGFVVFLLLIFSLLYSWLEKWSLFDSFYFCFVNLATIGYGDIVPVTVYGRSIFMIFIFATVPASTWFGTALAEVATGKWEVYIEKSDMEDEIMKKESDKKNNS